MDWYPLWNSLRIALISCAAVFFLGIFAAYYIARLPRAIKGVLDVVLTLSHIPQIVLCSPHCRPLPSSHDKNIRMGKYIFRHDIQLPKV